MLIDAALVTRATLWKILINIAQCPAGLGFAGRY